MRKWVAVLVAVCVLVLLTACGDTTPTAVDKTIERRLLEGYQLGPSPAYTLKTLAEEAEYIVVADVLSQHYADEFGMDRYNLVKVNVIDTLKGDVQGEILIEDNGMAYRGYPEETPPPLEEVRVEYSWGGEPLMRKGHRVVLFLTSVEDGEYTVYRLTQRATGKYFYDPADGLYHHSLEYSDEYQEYIKDGEQDTFGVSLLDDMTPKTLDEIKTLIG